MGKGLRPLCRDGLLLGEDGAVTLYDDEESVIARAQVAAVWAHKAGFPVKGLQIHIDGSKFTLDQAPAPMARQSPALIVSYIRRTGALSDSFLAWLSANGGNVGDPPLT